MQHEEWKNMIRQQAEMKYQAEAIELEVRREHLRRQHGLGHVVPPLPPPEHPTVSAWTTVHHAMEEEDADWEAQGGEEDQPP